LLFFSLRLETIQSLADVLDALQDRALERAELAVAEDAVRHHDAHERAAHAPEDDETDDDGGLRRQEDLELVERADAEPEEDGQQPEERERAQEQDVGHGHAL